MASKQPQEGLTLMEAVDNLSTMAELEIPSTPFDEELQSANFLDSTHISQNPETVKETFRAINNYLEHIYQKEKGELKDAEMQRGIEAIMVLAGEAAQKLDKYTSLFKGARSSDSVLQLKEYKDLQNFYLSKIVKRFHGASVVQEVFKQESEAPQEEGAIDLQKRGLKDLETVRRDREYELFYIRKENGQPFFNPNLLRHVRLVGEFDETVSDPEGDDPLLKIKIVEDVDTHTAAKEILQLASQHLDDYFKDAMHHKDRECISALNGAIMALMLAANPRNRMSENATKNCISYFSDFHAFLRQALNSEEYRKYIATEASSRESFIHAVVNLSLALSSGLFMHVGNRKAATSFIQRLIEKGESKIKRKKSHTVWEELLEDDERIRYVLKRYPNGPLLKTLDLFREGDERMGFDPFSQENFPSQLYTVVSEDLHVTALRFPAPIHQEVINKVEVVPEFQGFLRSLQQQMKGQRHLLFNLQDRTSWQEHARCSVLEKMQNEAEFSKALTVVTICKNTEFYNQSGAYQAEEDAEGFIVSFKEQIASGESCGFFFPSSLDREEIVSFTEGALHTIHETFFDSKKALSRKERLDFIEIFYQFLFMKLILMIKPDSMSFTCKDSIDIGEATAAGFFAFVKMLEGRIEWSASEKEFLLWMLYSPALQVRERPIDTARFTRMVSAMSQADEKFSANKKAFLEKARKLLGQPLLNKLEIKPAA
ncbi:MAG: hypothetical protein HYX48_05695 [Chlamydiales bacterium]|nr:hypothetical protein [Chlamydiales bacterium]